MLEDRHDIYYAPVQPVEDRTGSRDQHTMMDVEDVFDMDDDVDRRRMKMMVDPKSCCDMSVDKDERWEPEHLW